MLFRGVPLVVQLFIWYFGLPHLGIYLSPFSASVMGFSLCSGAYQSEYVRGALLSIKRGQKLAAQALGFRNSRWWDPSFYRRRFAGPFRVRQ